MLIVLIRHGERQRGSITGRSAALSTEGHVAKSQRENIATSSSDENEAIARFIRVLANAPNASLADDPASKKALPEEQKQKFYALTDDLLSPLSKQGEDDTTDIRHVLEQRSFVPDVYLTSAAEHAKQTAAILAGRFPGQRTADTLALVALTSYSGVARDEPLSARQLGRGEGVCVSANTIDDFLAGKGSIDYGLLALH